MNLELQMRELAASARSAARTLATATGRERNKALLALADLLQDSRQEIFAANTLDLDAARAGGLDEARIDRLRITDAGVDSMAGACRHVAALSDPVGEVEGMIRRPNGLLVGRMRIPLGVIAIIYESRPNVTIDAAILCLKAGNSVILRGGSEAYHSNQILGGLLRRALEAAGLPGGCVQIVPTTERAAVKHLLALDEYIDVVIPRGGEGLIRAVVKDATMPVLKHYKGVCHIYMHKDADQEQALPIIENAKVQRPGVCNALECLLVHEGVAREFLPRLAAILAPQGVSFRACPRSLPLLGATATPAEADDFGREFLSLTLAVKVVATQAEAEEHIACHGSGHSEAILTRTHDRAMRFLRTVDASCVLINASTRFNDGGELGLGAEIGISTSKIHAYGPMGVKELTSLKYIVFGEGQVRV
ncbi:glutamate-5-semialdehyde dehydrogenase [Desulfomicrobium baculatum]|uniref:Gamma-glutamyl phosphate reductase n=1 Tax=Desulfomicrobium baculatum (strain DSM 4028 / VKM B-1378 / X) TaxID=525897 RepID=C7LTX3_DESBD|nr:glutamate-5-semialdehyde dehydrogenase [Desulfomicrobium baculatum]ACU89596.1 gamma-glutamyl phosphate reductase [Desulfomicrobium baculatum DSM 4028]